jgi:hypothetical protein
MVDLSTTYLGLTLRSPLVRDALSQHGVVSPAAFERGQYFRVTADPRYRPTARPGPDQPVWQVAEGGYRGHLASADPADPADAGRRPLNYGAGGSGPPADAVED